MVGRAHDLKELLVGWVAALLVPRVPVSELASASRDVAATSGNAVMDRTRSRAPPAGRENQLCLAPGSCFDFCGRGSGFIIP